MLMSFSSTRSSVGVPFLTAWAAPDLRRWAPGWLSPNRPSDGGAVAAGGAAAVGVIPAGGAATGGAAGGGAAAAGGAAGGGAAAAGAAGGGGGGAATAGFASVAAALGGSGFDGGDTFGAAARGGRSGFSDFSARGFSVCGASVALAAGFSVGWLSDASRAGVFSTGLSCGGTVFTGVGVFSLLLAKFPSLPGRLRPRTATAVRLPGGWRASRAL